MTSCSRRDFLHSAAGMGLWFALPALDLRAARQRGPERKRSIITLWLAGGPSQLETWDPHPGGSIGGPTLAIATSIPGIQIARHFPQVAEQLQHLSLIRSLVSKEGDHERGSYLLKTGYRPEVTLVHPALGAIAAHQLPDSSVDIPQFISLAEGPFRSRGGYLGDQFDPFHVSEPGRDGHNLESQVSADRQQRRLQNLELVSRTFTANRRIRVDQTLHQHTIAAALRMMSSVQLRAFQIEEEPIPIQQAYGDTSFGRGCLVARRLVEQGVRAIEVSLQGFDSHADNFTAHELRGKILDPALATLIQDLRTRDLWASTVIFVIGEFGRTPNINPLDGRDHWPTGAFAQWAGEESAPGSSSAKPTRKEETPAGRSRRNQTPVCHDPESPGD
ncbi:MAG: DUF1501 domain-containing protein [Planctomycetaceae bacterium]